MELFSTAGDPVHKLVDDDVFDIVVGPSGNVWIATDQGVARIDANRTAAAEHYDDFNGIPNRKTRVLISFRNNIYVGTWGGGMAIFNGTGWDAMPIQDGNKGGVVDGQITSFAPDVVNPVFMWIGTVAGLSRYEDNPNKSMPNRFTQYSSRLDDRPNNRLPEWRDVTSLFVRDDPTRGKELWVSRRRDGIIIVRFPSGQTRYRPGNSAIPSKYCNQVIYDPTSDLFWSVYSDKGIASVDVPNSLWTNYTRVNGYDNDLGSSIGVRSNGDMWIGTQGGVSRRKADGTITNYTLGSGLPDERVRRVYVNPATDDVWLAFVDGGAGRVLYPDN